MMKVKKPEWECVLISTSSDPTEPRSDWESIHSPPEVILTPGKGCQPCRFHRWMHRIMFGFRWQRKEGA